jgi:ATP-binding cassette subfamily B protein
MSKYLPINTDLSKFQSKSTKEIGVLGALKFHAQLFMKPKGLGVLFFALVAAGLALTWVIPRLIISKILTDLDSGIASSDDLYKLTFYIFLCTLTGEVLIRAVQLIIVKFTAEKTGELVTFANRRLLKQTIDFFSNNFIGSMVTKVSNISSANLNFEAAMLFSFTHIVIEISFAAIILGIKAPIMFIYFLIFVCILYIFMKVPFVNKATASYRLNEYNTRIFGIVADDFANNLAIKSFGTEDVELKRLESEVKLWEKHLIRFQRFTSFNVSGRLTPLTTIFMSLGIFLAIYSRFELNVPSDIVFLSFTSFIALTIRIWGFKELYETLEKDMSKSAETLNLLNEPVDIIDATDAKALNVNSGQITFENVGFKYHETYLFEKLNLQINPGEKIGLIGPSGGGKSTLLKMLLRFVEIESGRILIDNQNIQDVLQTSLRQNISYIPQEPVLFHRSIKENIMYGIAETNTKQFEEVVEITKINEFVNELPEGFDTLVGERGIKLSGGQKQRIAIARAMLKDAPIIILDEATSALDSHSEQIIQDALNVVMKDKTVIAIAHRLSTIAGLDKILVLESGRIIESGNHKELLSNKGLYHSLWEHQSGGYLGED